MAIVHLRILGYCLTLAMHVGNMIYMNNALEGPAMSDPNIRVFSALHFRFFTVWTFLVQILHAVLGLVCDYLVLKHASEKHYQPPKYLKKTKETIFSAILWPTVFLVSTLFWTLYHYDRSLIYPLYADLIMTRVNNHIVHTAIVPVVLWEVVLQPREVPEKHSTNITLLTVYMLTYLNMMCYTYFDTGTWLYPIFGLAYKTLYFPLIIIVIGVMLNIYYFMQWHITRLIWGSKVKTK